MTSRAPKWVPKSDPKCNQELPNADLSYPDTEYYCKTRPTAVQPHFKAMEDLRNWARSNSLWILAFGTGCGAIELRPLMTARFDAYRYGVMGAPTPRQACVFVIGGYASVKTLKRIVVSYEQMQNPKFVLALGSCTVNGGMYWDSYNIRTWFCSPRSTILKTTCSD